MSKKRKSPAASRMTTRTTEAPMRMSRASSDINSVNDEIARIAYARFEARGGAHGFDVEDWLAAEAAVRTSLV